jgi:hypothetical protein
VTIADAATCALCSQPATETVDPPRRTLARGPDPSDPSYSVTVILPDVALCAEHTLDVRGGARHVGWCDDPRCRTYGEISELSPCGDPYMKLSPGNHRSS